MGNFFNTYLNPFTIMEGKREWKKQMARVKELGNDYEYVYKKIMNYLFSYGVADEKIFFDLIELFESGAAEGKQVLEITGDDVAGFCDELIKDVKNYTDKWRKDMNSDIAKKIGKEHGKNE